MSNHLHVVLKTPQPNLARGMQAFLSGYANVWSRRHRFSGHVFQGRYRTELVEDETYLWTVTRYVHLNPVRAPTGGASGGVGLVELSRLCPSRPPSGVGGLRRAAGVLERCVRRAGPGGGVPAVCDRGVVRAAGVAMEGGVPRVDSRERSIHRSSQGDGAWRTSPRAAPGIATDTGSSPLTSKRGRLCHYEIDRAELRRRGSRASGATALAYLARSRTAATNAELAAMLGAVAGGERAQLDSAFRGLAGNRCESSQAVEGPGGAVG